MNFQQYLFREYRKGWDEIRDDLIFNGLEEDEIRERENQLIEEYEDYCEESGIDPEVV